MAVCKPSPPFRQCLLAGGKDLSNNCLLLLVFTFENIYKAFYGFSPAIFFALDYLQSPSSGHRLASQSSQAAPTSPSSRQCPASLPHRSELLLILSLFLSSRPSLTSQARQSISFCTFHSAYIVNLSEICMK